MTAQSNTPTIGRDRLRTILVLSLPIMGGMASQNVLNLVDTAMVGALGPTALAAVGLASFANFMAMAFVMGLSSGVQAMAARRNGQGRESETAVPLNGGLLLAVAIAVAHAFSKCDSGFPQTLADQCLRSEPVPRPEFCPSCREQLLKLVIAARFKQT